MENFESIKYKLLTLSNGMNVILVSDPDAETSAVALDVKIGRS